MRRLLLCFTAQPFRLRLQNAVNMFCFILSDEKKNPDDHDMTLDG